MEDDDKEVTKHLGDEVDNAKVLFCIIKKPRLIRLDGCQRILHLGYSSEHSDGSEKSEE